MAKPIVELSELENLGGFETLTAETLDLLAGLYYEIVATGGTGHSYFIVSCVGAILGDFSGLIVEDWQSRVLQMRFYWERWRSLENPPSTPGELFLQFISAPFSLSATLKQRIVYKNS